MKKLPTETFIVSLHTDVPRIGDEHECSYDGYARASSQWQRVAPGVRAPTKYIDFPLCKGGFETVKFFAVRGANGKMVHAGPVTPNVSVGTGVIPRLTKESTIVDLR